MLSSIPISTNNMSLTPTDIEKAPTACGSEPDRERTGILFRLMSFNTLNPSYKRVYIGDEPKNTHINCGSDYKSDGDDNDGQRGTDCKQKKASLIRRSHSDNTAEQRKNQKPKRTREGSVPGMWERRYVKLIDCIRESEEKCDQIVCMQEYWFDNGTAEDMFQNAFGETHHFLYAQRPKGKVDGLCTMVPRSKFDVIHKKAVFLGSGQRMALFVHLRLKETYLKTVTDGDSFKGSRDFVIANTHLTFPHSQYDLNLRAGQIQKLIASMDMYLEQRSLCGATCFLVGDFNGIHDPVYDHVVANGFTSMYYSVNGDHPGVTHHNHLPKDVSVDFVFHRSRSFVCGPATVAESVLATEAANGSTPADDTSKNGWRVTHACQCVPDSTVDSKAPAAIDSAAPSFIDFVPVAAELLPLGVPHATWPADYELSDHRPLVVDLSIKLHPSML